MKKKTKTTGTADSKPCKVLLHMARIDGDWVGRAVFFDRDEEHYFCNLGELVDWLEHRQTEKV